QPVPLALLAEQDAPGDVGDNGPDRRCERAHCESLGPSALPSPEDAAVACAPVTVASIPSPSTAVWHLGPIPIRAYALCIVAGIVVACAVTEMRMRRRGAPPYLVLDVAVWAVPFGIVGARLYHVISSPEAYFGKGGPPWK